MQSPDLAELLRAKTKARLSESTNREELIDQGVCVACRTNAAIATLRLVHCENCHRRLAAADHKAFAGFWREAARG